MFSVRTLSSAPAAKAANPLSDQLRDLVLSHLTSTSVGGFGGRRESRSVVTESAHFSHKICHIFKKNPTNATQGSWNGLIQVLRGCNRSPLRIVSAYIHNKIWCGACT